MRQFFPVFYWLAAVLTITFVLVSLSYSFTQAFFVAVMFLPGMLIARYLLPRLCFCDRRKGIYHLLCLVGAILFTVYLGVMLTNLYVREIDFDPVKGFTGMPGLLNNPLFILLVLVAFVIPEALLEQRFRKEPLREKSIGFISDRHKVTLDPADILYVESNDSEVRIHTVSGESFRTKTRISQWESLLDSRFLRIHRSFIINTDRIGQSSPTHVTMGEKTIEISRKYREQAEQQLRKTREK